MRLLADAIKGYDFHCHVDLHKDPRATIARCDADRIFVIAVTTTPKAFPTNAAWTSSSQYVFPAVGLHPEVVGDRFSELPLALSLMKEATFIGEVGLDGSPQFKRSYDKQREVFIEVLKAAQRIGGKVVTIHSRWADKEVVELIEQLTTPDRVLCILHWFSGSQASMRRAALAGCYFSINANMLDNARAAALVGTLPPDRILTETDAPFGSTDQRASEPWDVIRTGQRIPLAGGAEGGSIIRENATRVLRFANLID